MANKRSCIAPGDVFAIPIPSKGFGACQVIFSGAAQFVVVFEELFREPCEIQGRRALDSSPALISWTVDALIHNGRWMRIGNAPIDWARIPLPAYAVMIDGVPHVEDTEGKRCRPATDQEFARLGLRKTVAPIRIQNALAALHGLAPWKPEYDELTRDQVARSAEVVV